MTLTTDDVGLRLRDHQRREFQIRTAAIVDDGEPVFTGIGVPYDTEIQVWDWRESFAPGSVTGADTAKILWRHDDPIGKVIEATDTPDGIQITGRLSDTDRGREAYQLLKDGVIDRLSIGFTPIEWITDEIDGTVTVRYTEVQAREFSLVPFPAYDTATITEVRNQQGETPMTNTSITRTQLTEALDAHDQAITGRLEDMERSLARIEAHTTTPTPAGAQFRSMGHLLQQIAAGDDKAAEFHRAYAGGTANDDITKGTPVGEFIKWVDERLTTINLFSRGTLPPTGNTLEYVRMEPRPADGATAISTQPAEGDSIAGPFKVKISEDNARIETWGGWTEISRQRIERSQHNYLDKLLRVMGLEWARYAETRFKAFFTEKLAERESAAITLAAAPDYTEYLGAIIDAGDAFSAGGYSLDGLALSPDKFKELALIEAADGRPLMSVYGTGSNITGELDLPAGSGNLAGVPVNVIWETTGLATFYDSSALQIDFSPGAPAQLQDENIIELSKTYSLYGYAALYDPFPGGLIPINYGA